MVSNYKYGGGVVSNAEEKANEVWDAEVDEKLATMKAAIARIDEARRTIRRDDLGAIIHEALLMEMQAADDLWKMRHGPENPDE